MGDREFSLYDIEQFLREAGAERVTEDAVLNLERELSKLTEKIAKRAVGYAAHAGRKKLIRREDVLLTRGISTDYSRPANFSKNARTTNIASKAQR